MASQAGGEVNLDNGGIALPVGGQPWRQDGALDRKEQSLLVF
jgi:hypothetical protein